MKCLSLLFFMIFTVPCFAGDLFQVERFDHKSHAIHYNRLPTVEDADRELKAKQSFNEFLEEARKIVVASGLSEYIGLRLIHNHFDLSEGEVMVEYFGVHNGTPSLITSAFNATVAQEKEAFPSGLIFTDSKVMVFELSTDPAVKVGFLKMQQNPEFVEQLRRLVENYGLQKLIAIGVIKRDGLLFDAGKRYVEKSFISFGRGESVVQVTTPDDPESLIPTSWYFGEDPLRQGCHPMNCLSYCLRDYSRGGVHIGKRHDNHG